MVKTILISCGATTTTTIINYSGKEVSLHSSKLSVFFFLFDFFVVYGKAPNFILGSAAGHDIIFPLSGKTPLLKHHLIQREGLAEMVQRSAVTWRFSVAIFPRIVLEIDGSSTTDFPPSQNHLVTVKY